MKKNGRGASGPRGGLRAGEGATRGWRWGRSGALVSAPVRCKREQWYMARGRLADSELPGRTELMMRFLHDDETATERTLTLYGLPGAGAGSDLIGWVQAPDDATYLQLHLRNSQLAGRFAEVVFHPVAERDPKCHPLANVPRWSTHQPAFPLTRIVLPPALAELAQLVGEPDVQIQRPRSGRALAKAASGAACVLDPAWVTEFGLQWEDLERIAGSSWLIVDLETTWKLLRRTGLEPLRLVTHEAPHGIMSARVEYADVATRGFALQDVFPYATISETGGFVARVLQANRTWKRYADEEGFATLLASETPDPDHCGDVLSATRPVGRGELIVTDLPWLVAGQFGPLLAPRLAAHALRMHLGRLLADDVQYWNRWDDGQIVVRDISDLARRYAPLRAIRWASADGAVVPLGAAVPALEGAPSACTLVIRTGRIDNAELHTGLPPEPMIIFMKMLAREARERTVWAERYLRDLTVCWQFDTADGLRYAANYASAATVAPQPSRVVTLTRPGPDAGQAEIVTDDEGIFGDGALEYQARLGARAAEADRTGVGVSARQPRLRPFASRVGRCYKAPPSLRRASLRLPVVIRAL